MNDHNKDKDYLKDLAPRLFSEEMDKKREVPEGYFDSVEERVLAKLRDDGQEEEGGKVRSLINFRNLGIAAGLAVLLALIPLLKNMTDDRTKIPTASVAVQLESFSEEAVVLYLAEEYDLESIAADIDFAEAVYVEDDELSEEEIFDYLLDSEMSESLIYESL